jgi:hypothetical protein
MVHRLTLREKVMQREPQKIREIWHMNFLRSEYGPHRLMMQEFIFLSVFFYSYLSFYCTFFISLSQSFFNCLRLPSLHLTPHLHLPCHLCTYFHTISISLPITTIKINSIKRSAPNNSARVPFWKQNFFLANTKWKRNFIFYRKTHVQMTNKPRSPRSEYQTFATSTVPLGSQVAPLLI